MGFNEIRQRLSEAIKAKQEEFREAQALNEAKDDYETADKALRNKRREVRKYIDKDEKERLEAFLRARRAQEDKSWLNPFGMLDTQEINISRPQVNIFAGNDNIHRIDSKRKTNNILDAPNRFARRR